MRLLLDTHAFLWWVMDAKQMSDGARNAIGNPDNQVLLSPVCGWEIAIKTTLGRLDLPSPATDSMPEQLHRNGFGVLPVSMHHALEVSSLPTHHQDPFDRLLIAQSRSEGIPVISGDAAFRSYDVEIVW